MGKMKVWGIVSMAACVAATCLIVAGPAEGLSPPVPEKATYYFSNGGRIVSVKADGSDFRVITGKGEGPDPLYGDFAPAVSPDGTMLAFVRMSETTDHQVVSRIVVTGPDGNGPETSPVHPAPPADGTEIWLSGPSWSPDSSRIFYTKRREGFWQTTAEVDSVRPDGTDRETLIDQVVKVNVFNDNSPNYLTIDSVDVSPDGKSLLVSQSGYWWLYGGSGRVDIFNLASKKSRLVSRNAYGGTWSPDGSKILFGSQRNRIKSFCNEGRCGYYSKAFIMNRDGGGVRKLVPGRGRFDEGVGSWAPDGSTIIFGSDRLRRKDRYRFQLYSIRPDGSCLTQLTSRNLESLPGTWVPDSGDDFSARDCGA